MAKTGYICERCSALYDYLEHAKQCERDHADRENNSEIRRFGWKHDANKRGEYPDSVVIAFSDNMHDFATYRLERIGFRSA